MEYNQLDISYPDDVIDIPGLIKEQSMRSTWMENCLTHLRKRESTSWDEVLNMLELVPPKG